VLAPDERPVPAGAPEEQDALQARDEPPEWARAELGALDAALAPVSLQASVAARGQDELPALDAVPLLAQDELQAFDEPLARVQAGSLVRAGRLEPVDKVLAAHSRLADSRLEARALLPLARELAAIVLRAARLARAAEAGPNVHSAEWTELVKVQAERPELCTELPAEPQRLQWRACHD